jgi:hypothetical protein
MVLCPHFLDAHLSSNENLPTEEELAIIQANDFVKVCNGTERFWIQVIEKKDRGYFDGIVMNKLIFKSAYTLGSLVQFHTRHVYQIQHSIEAQH